MPQDPIAPIDVPNAGAARAAGIDENGPYAARHPTEALRHLETFIGRWRVSGRNSDAAPIAAGHAIRGENHFEWVPGMFFAMNRFQREISDISHAGVTVFGFEEAQGAFFAHNFDSLGYERRYRVELHDGVWQVLGRFERARMVFGVDGLSYEEAWEISNDGETFTPLCEMRSVKLGAHA